MEKGSFNQEFSIATEGEEIKEGTRGSRTASIAVNSFFTLSILLSLGMVVFSLIFFLSIVEGPSMMTKINAYYQEDPTAKDSVLVNRYAAPQRGDIIVTKYYWDPNNPREQDRWDRAINSDEKGRYEYFVKRLIAIEGDRIEFLHHETGGVPLYDVYLNGELLIEPYLHPYWGQLAYWSHPHSSLETVKDSNGVVLSYALTVPEGKIFFMGDNRGSTDRSDFVLHSYDCREVGPQPRENVVGTVKDIIEGQESMPEYLLRKIGEFFTFGG